MYKFLYKKERKERDGGVGWRERGEREREGEGRGEERREREERAATLNAYSTVLELQLQS